MSANCFHSPVSTAVFLAVVLILSGIIHFFIKRFWVGVVVATVISSIIALVSQIATSTGAGPIRPADLVFWVPFTLLIGGITALPIVLAVGACSYWIRRSRRKS
jgi:hypothetical protein